MRLVHISARDSLIALPEYAPPVSGTKQGISRYPRMSTKWHRRRPDIINM
jgi:hypothetical protein